jgi:HTH-type transcriptional regulator/antitoxin HigA
VGEDKSHPLASLMEIEGFLIEGYEDWHVPELAE